MTMNAMGTGPIRFASNEVKLRSMIPPGVSRRLSEIPLRMLSVARVAMIDGIFNPRTRPALTSPRVRPARKTTPTPRTTWAVHESGPITNDAITTPRVTIAPTERSR